MRPLTSSRIGFAAAAVAAAAACAVGPVSAGEPPQLGLPVDCTVGQTCFVQNHVDLDPGAGVRDFACGAATYDGHSGVDLRVLSAAVAAAGVAVVAAAPGRVVGVRDGMADAFLRDGAGAGASPPSGGSKNADTTGRECGNGVVIDHGGGWVTQYCHLRRGSVSVAKGANVSRGTRLGLVGYSGFADFAHLHFAVRHQGVPVDPFTAARAGGSCLADASEAVGLWDKATAAALVYRDGEIIETGFAVAVPGTLALEHGGARVGAPGPTSAGLVFFARLINLREGDRLRLTVSGPEGFAVADTSTPLDRPKAVYVGGAGRRLTRARWASGRYEGLAEVLRNGRVVATSRGHVDMP